MASLKRGEFLLCRKNYSKVMQLSVDKQSEWLYTTRPRDRRRRKEAIEQFGREEGIRHLVASATAR
jgi:hypothetical protein